MNVAMPLEANGKILAWSDGHKFMDEPPEASWSYREGVREVAQIYGCGADMDSICPEELKAERAEIKACISAHLKSLVSVGINPGRVDLRRFVPETDLLRFMDNKCRIAEQILEQPKPADYDFRLSLEKLLRRISRCPLNVNLEGLSEPLRAKLSAYGNRVVYNQWGSITKRLTTVPGTFPILNLKTEYRSTIRPNNDLFIEFDYNGIDLRMFLLLSGREQPQIDVHEWNLEKIFEGVESRKKAKGMFFSWLYGSSSQELDGFRDRLEKEYNRDGVLRERWDGERVWLPSGSSIEADEHHALPRLIQASASEYFLTKKIEVDNLLKGLKSYLAFTVHDSAVIDTDESEIELVIARLKPLLESENFMVNMSLGTNYKDMKKV